MVECYYKYVLYFFLKWKEVEMWNVFEIEDSVLK